MVSGRTLALVLRGHDITQTALAAAKEHQEVSDTDEAVVKAAS